LANAIEKSNQDAIDDILRELLGQYQEKTYDAVVLGCTHYNLIQDRIQSFFPTAKLINGNKEIANHVKTLLKTQNLESTNKKPGKTEYFYSK